MYQNRDILWKGLLELVFDDFLRFVYPKADETFDLKKGFTFLDKELAEISPATEEGINIRFADKLVKVYRRDGSEEWILIHIEVQAETKAQDRPTFPERMFRYFYRVLDRYKMPVEAIAIFTGKDGRQMLDIYNYNCVESWLLYRYKTICALDYTDAELSESNNPFALVILIARQALLKGMSLDKNLLAGKLFVFRRLYERRALDRRKMKAILNFLDNYVQFEDPRTNLIFRNEVDTITGKKNTMDFFQQCAEIRAHDEREWGKKEGAEMATRKFVENLLENYDIDEKEVAAMVGVTMAYVRKIKATLKKQVG